MLLQHLNVASDASNMCVLPVLVVPHPLFLLLFYLLCFFLCLQKRNCVYDHLLRFSFSAFWQQVTPSCPSHTHTHTQALYLPLPSLYLSLTLSLPLYLYLLFLCLTHVNELGLTADSFVNGQEGKYEGGQGAYALGVFHTLISLVSYLC